jgi:hypothetical protein
MVTHHGDTRGNDWYSQAECMSVDPTSSGIVGVPDAKLLTLL